MQLIEHEVVRESSRSPERSARISSLVWLNLFCLDAPLVAITWQWLFGRSFGISLTASSRAALFLTAWLIYLADRLADTWALRSDDPRSLRQAFCERYSVLYVGHILSRTHRSLDHLAPAEPCHCSHRNDGRHALAWISGGKLLVRQNLALVPGKGNLCWILVRGWNNYGTPPADSSLTLVHRSFSPLRRAVFFELHQHRGLGART